jgi:pimeloyl-ACP methyl ester carboxylesterase
MKKPSIYHSALGEKAVMDSYDTVLASWPVTNVMRNIPTRFGSTFVIQSGEPARPPIILLHGAGTNSAMWVEDVRALAQSYQVFAVDLPGEPGKSSPYRIPWAGSAWAEWLDEVLEKLHVPRATLIGMSQGGWVAAKYATYQPARLEKLVLMTPAGIVPDNLWFALLSIPLSLAGPPGIRIIVRLLFGKYPAPKALRDATTLTLTHFKPRMGIVPLLADTELMQITMPTLLMVGERDILRNGRRIERRMETRVPHLSTVMLPEEGHAILHGFEHVSDFLAHQDTR